MLQGMEARVCSSGLMRAEALPRCIDVHVHIRWNLLLGTHAAGPRARFQRQCVHQRHQRLLHWLRCLAQVAEPGAPTRAHVGLAAGLLHQSAMPQSPAAPLLYAATCFPCLIQLPCRHPSSTQLGFWGNILHPGAMGLQLCLHIVLGWDGGAGGVCVGGGGSLG